MLMGILSPQQQNQVNQFKNKDIQEQAEEVAKMCNEKGITKEQLQKIYSVFK
jgi:hypothetical protein